MKIFSRLIIILIALSSTHRAIPAAAAAAAAGTTEEAVYADAAELLAQTTIDELKKLPVGSTVRLQQDVLKGLVLDIMSALPTMYPKLSHLIILSDVDGKLGKASRSAGNRVDPRYLYCVRQMLLKISKAYKSEEVAANKKWNDDELNTLLDAYITENADTIEAMRFPTVPLAGAASRSTPTATPSDVGACGGGSSSPAAAVSAAAHGGAGASAAYAVPAPLGRRVATSGIVREMFDHSCTNQVNTTSAYNPDALSPLECALRVTNLDFNNREIVDEMIATIQRKIESGSSEFFLYLNALLAAVEYNGNAFLKAALREKMPAEALVPSLLKRQQPGDLPVQTCVMNSLKTPTVKLYPDDALDKTDQLHGHEFCFPFSEESSASTLMRISCLGKYITFIPATIGAINTSSHSFKSGSGRVLRQALIILGSLPASPSTFVYGRQLVQLLDTLKKSGDVNVATPDVKDKTFAPRIVDLLSERDEKTMIKYLIDAVRQLTLSPEAIIDHLQLIVQLSADTDLEVVAYAVFKKVALGFAFGLSQAQIVEVLEKGKLV